MHLHHMGVRMQPTIADGQWIEVTGLMNLRRPISRGDIVVFNMAPYMRQTQGYVWTLRVVGLPGETVEVRDGHVLIDGEVLDEPYVSTRPVYAFGPSVVAQGSYFVLGDNRQYSFDSSKFVHPWVKRRDIFGVVEDV